MIDFCWRIFFYCGKEWINKQTLMNITLIHPFYANCSFIFYFFYFSCCSLLPLFCYLNVIAVKIAAWNWNNLFSSLFSFRFLFSYFSRLTQSRCLLSINCYRSFTFQSNFYFNEMFRNFVDACYLDDQV